MNREEEILKNMIFFFMFKYKHTLTKTKLMKLLYFCDKKHIEQTGSPMTGLQYFAWEYGPVPTDVYYGLASGKNNSIQSMIAENFKVRQVGDSSIISAKSTFPLTENIFKEFFTPRQWRILGEVVFTFKKANVKLVSEASHESGGAWDYVRNSPNELSDEITYPIIISCANDLTSDEKDEIREKLQEYLYDKELSKQYSKNGFLN